MGEGRHQGDWELLHVAKLGKPHGVRGQVRLWPLESGSTTLVSVGTLFIGDDPSGRRAKPYKVRTCKPSGRYLIATLEGVAGREQAEALRNKPVFIRNIDLPKLDDPDEYYLYDLKGLEVFTVAGERIGVVHRLMETGPVDVLVIRDEEQASEVMVPFVEAIVTSVEIAQGRVVIDPPEGLMEATRVGVRGE